MSYPSPSSKQWKWHAIRNILRCGQEGHKLDVQKVSGVALGMVKQRSCLTKKELSGTAQNYFW